MEKNASDNEKSPIVIKVYDNDKNEIRVGKIDNDNDKPGCDGDIDCDVDTDGDSFSNEIDDGDGSTDEEGDEENEVLYEEVSDVEFPSGRKHLFFFEMLSFSSLENIYSSLNYSVFLVSHHVY